MELNHNYIYIQSALTKENCNKIIELGKAKIEEYRSKGIRTHGITAGNKEKQSLPNAKALDYETHENKKEEDYYIRDSEVSWLTDKWIYDLVMPHVHTANRISGWNFDIENAESFQFTKYGLNQFYGWHSDGSGCHKSAYKRYYPGVNGQGLTPINDVMRCLTIEEFPDRNQYETIAGFMIYILKRLPKRTDHFTQGYKFEVLDLEGVRVEQVLVTKLK